MLVDYQRCAWPNTAFTPLHQHRWSLAQGASMFEHMFGGGLGGQRMRMRPTFQTAMMISFEDAVKGTTQTVDLSSLGIPGLGKKKTVELNIPAGV